MVTAGGVLSRLMVRVVETELSARSMAVPVTFWLAASVLTVLERWQLAMPESASEQAKLTATSVLFQPAAFAGGDCDVVMAGDVSSMRTESVFLPSTLPALSFA